MTPTISETKFKYQSGFGNEFASEAVAGALPVGRNSPQKSLRRAVFGNVFYDAAPFEQTHVDVSHSAVGSAPPVPANRKQAARFAVRRNRYDTESTQVESFADARSRNGFR
jgi:homogentisate 1,2-dioxygenase